MFILQLNAQFISNRTTTQALKLLNSKFHTEYLKKCTEELHSDVTPSHYEDSVKICNGLNKVWMELEM